MIDIDLDKTGNLIANLRKQEELTQVELAKKLRITPQAVSKWENGLSLPDIVALLKLSDFFNITIDKLLKGEQTVKENSNETRDKKTMKDNLENFTKNNDITEVFVDGKRKQFTLNPNPNPDSQKNIKYIDNDTVIVEKNGESFYYNLNDSKLPKEKSEIKDDSSKTYESCYTNNDQKNNIKTKLSINEKGVKSYIKKNGKEYIYNYYSSINKEKEENSDTLSIHQLVGMAPYMSKRSLDKILDTLKEKDYPIEQILALAPFISSEKINALADKIIKTNEIEKISALLPFIEKDKINTLVKQLTFEDDFKKLEILLPFIGESTLSDIVNKIELKNINLPNLSLIAPYLNNKVLKNIIKNLPNNSDTINLVTPYLDDDNLAELIKQVKKKLLPRKILAIIAPFLSDEQLDRLIE